MGPIYPPILLRYIPPRWKGLKTLNISPWLTYKMMDTFYSSIKTPTIKQFN